MDYLDYLAEFTYDELPAGVAAAVSEAEYTARRAVVLQLAEPREDGLPADLATAFRNQHHGSSTSSPVPNIHRLAVSRRSRGALLWPLLAAAGWLLLLGLFLFPRQPEAPRVIYRAISAPVLSSAPSSDTIVRTEISYRTRTVHDTVVLREPAPPPLVEWRTDTVYVAMPTAPSLGVPSGSQSIAGRERVLELLYTTE